MRAQLIPVDGGAPIDLVKDVTLVGRKEDCDLRLEHKSISKMHCVLVKTDGLLLLRDLGSTNGTRVNGQRVRRAALLPNDQLTIAGFKYRIWFGPDEVAPPAPAVPQHEHTQQLDARDVARLLRNPEGHSLEDSAPDLPAMPVLQNPLPDVYPEESSEKRV
jgi:pSer/pThr/pTyr-binding forkhead associated (FHA) protein